MHTDRDTTRLVRSWLEEGATALPDRVLDAVLDQVPATPQRRSLWPPRRSVDMNNALKVAIGAAAVVLVAFVGINLLPGEGGRGGAVVSPTAATPSPSAAPTPKPSVAVPSVSAKAGLPVGSSYLLINGRGVKGTVTVAAPGWGGDGGVMVKNDSGDPPDGAGMIVFVGEDLFVYGDPCKWSSTTPKTPATTVDELAAALSVQASRDASAPVEITVGGYAGKSITLHVPGDAAYSAGKFTECDQGYFGSWGTTSEPTPARYHQGPGQIDELWILDVDGVLTVIDTAYYAGTPVEHVDEIRAIVRSATFE